MAKIWFLKKCPHCGGDLYKDLEDISCLQCGWVEYEKVLVRR